MSGREDSATAAGNLLLTLGTYGAREGCRPDRTQVTITPGSPEMQSGSDEKPSGIGHPPWSIPWASLCRAPDASLFVRLLNKFRNRLGTAAPIIAVYSSVEDENQRPRPTRAPEMESSRTEARRVLDPGLHCVRVTVAASSPPARKRRSLPICLAPEPAVRRPFPKEPSPWRVSECMTRDVQVANPKIHPPGSPA